MELTLRRFDIKSIDVWDKLMFIGCDKNTLIKDYLYRNIKTFPIGLMISTNKNTSMLLSEHISKTLMHDAYDSSGFDVY